MKNMRIRLLALALLTTLLLSACVPALGEGEKEEVVYVTLDSTGAQTGVYAVNILPGGDLVDYGAYSAVRNMTTEDTLDFDGECVTVSTQAERLYYEGTLPTDTPLPWNIEITYALDGEPISAETLAGKSGALEMTILISHNPDYSGNLYDVFALQTTVTLDTFRCRNIDFEDAIAVNVGADKQLIYTVLPGKGDSIVIRADVSCFEMEPVSVNAMAFRLPLDTSTISNASQLSQLNVVSLNTRVSAALAGKLQSAATAFREDIDSLIPDEPTQAINDLVAQMLASASASFSDLLNGELLTEENYQDALAAVRTDENAWLVDATQKLIEAALALATKATEYVQDLSDIAVGSLQALCENADQLAESAATLQEKAATLKDDVVDGITEYIEEMIPSDYSLTSFVDARNGGVESLLFVFQTPSVAIQQVEAGGQATEEEDGFFDRLLDLFR